MSDVVSNESCEELLNQLHQRLIATGEWSTLLLHLRRMLEESEWDVQLRQRAEREAQSQDALHLPTLVSKLGPFAQETIPESVREAITAQLRSFLDRNLEDA
ncbi:hypothetical protein MVES_001921 [Malassezia vespertilionis]|uniref:Transcription and mRNA export factor SUS1 n=1 Tax=Malassezia vespertilionis TaxID=2020962 RepID=A0A2N1JBR8_9BASI|nr:hypothetical protein MVES_001921 [Malassezia vespertilionis]